MVLSWVPFRRLTRYRKVSEIPTPGGQEVRSVDEPVEEEDRQILQSLGFGVWGQVTSLLDSKASRLAPVSELSLSWLL